MELHINYTNNSKSETINEAINANEAINDLFLLGIQKKSKSNDKFDLDFLFFGSSKGDCCEF